MISLARQYWQFVRFKGSAPRPRYLEIDQDWREALPGRVGASGRLLQATLGTARSVLDVGAGDRYERQVLRNLGVKAVYKSADIAQSDEPHDYADFLEVGEPFDGILMLEVLEHLPQEVGVRFMEHAFELLPAAGVLVVSTPNAQHPNSVWRYEVTHVRPWPAPDLYGVLKLIGFSRVTLYRQYLRGLTWRRRAVAPLSKMMHRVMDLDFAQTVIVVAVK